MEFLAQIRLLFYVMIVVSLALAGFQVFFSAAEEKKRTVVARLMHTPSVNQTYYERYYHDIPSERQNLDDVDHDAMFAASLGAADRQSLYKLWSDEYKRTFAERNGLPPLNAEKWLDFAVRHDCRLHPNYYLQIDKDLAPFRRLRTDERPGPPINFAMLRRASQLHKYKNVVEIYQRKMYVKNKPKATYPPFTAELIKIFPENRRILIVINHHDNPIVLVPDADFVESHSTRKHKLGFTRNKCMLDNYEQYAGLSGFLMLVDNLQPTELLPVFSTSKTICHADILMPYKTILTERPLNDSVPWASKKKRLLWRGSTTGSGWGSYAMGKMDYRMLPRLRLNEWAKQMEKARRAGSSTMPFQVDVGFTAIKYCPRNLCRTIERNYMSKDFVPYEEHTRVKYLLAIDGHTWPSRFRPFLFGHSLVFLCTIFVEWFSSLARPWHHYVPVDLSLDDLTTNIRMAVEHDEQSRLIGERGARLAQRHLKFEHMQCYVGLLTLEYAELLDLENVSDILH